MTICETLPLCPDTTVAADPVVTEPMEVGPFYEGVVFVRVLDASVVDVDVGVSPIGYDAWRGAWTVRQTRTDLAGPGMYEIPLENFGNWIRLRLTARGDAATVLAWFVGKG